METNSTTTDTQIPHSPTYVPGVTLYGNFPAHDRSICEAIAFHERNDKTVTLMLGQMRDGYLGREVVTLDDLHRWAHEEDEAAQWAAIEDGERAAAEMGLLR